MTRNNLARVWAAWAVLAVFMVGCTSLGLQPAKSFDERLAYAYSTHTSVLTAAANSVEAGTLGADDAQQLLAMTDDARLLLDSARVAATGGDVGTAEGRLTLATNVLTELLNYLNSKGKR